jgi:tetratricopeptide (TPR) repeat protein
MKQEIDFSRYIDRYLCGVMSSDERIWFLKEVEGNKLLQEDLQLHQKLNSLISEQKTISLQEQLNSIHKNLFDKGKRFKPDRKPSRKVIYYTIGIATSLVLSGIVISRQINTPLDSKYVYAEYFKPADIAMSFRSADNSAINNDLRLAMAFYENKKFNDAIRIFEDILNKDSSRIGLNLYSGISYMEIKEYAEANKKFNKIIDHKANAFIESAQWYLGLCYLMTEEPTKAKNVFMGIANSESYFRKDAKRILKKMD